LTDARVTPFFAALRRTLAAWGAPSAGDTVVVALSGGADSVALTDAMASAAPLLGFQVVLAHLDHQLRDSASADSAFCADFARRLGVPFRLGRADVRGRMARDHAGLEDAARRERYEFLQAVRHETGARFIALGHTRDDQAETFLLRLLRGAGADGLGSMRPRSGELLRPILTLSRQDVLDHLAARGLAWREDPTNGDVALLRNRVRHELLPYLETRFNPEVRDALARAAELLAEDSAALDARLGARLAETVRTDGASRILPLAALTGAPVGESRRLLRGLVEQAGGLRGVSAHHIEAVRALCDKPGASGHHLPLPGRRQALVSFGELRVGPAPAVAAVYELPLSVPGRVDLPGGLSVCAALEPGPRGIALDSAVIAAPASALVVRTRRAGDRVEEAGREMSLKRFLMRHRIPAPERAGLPLVASGSRVLWVPGRSPVQAPTGGVGSVRLSLERTA
jgi:tRNA(Ile)-lysidine synthase